MARRGGGAPWPRWRCRGVPRVLFRWRHRLQGFRAPAQTFFKHPPPPSRRALGGNNRGLHPPWRPHARHGGHGSTLLLWGTSWGLPQGPGPTARDPRPPWRPTPAVGTLPPPPDFSAPYTPCTGKLFSPVVPCGLAPHTLGQGGVSQVVCTGGRGSDVHWECARHGGRLT